MRTETEWVETLNDNWNVIVSADKNKILNAVDLPMIEKQESYFGNGNTAELIIESLKRIEV